MPDQSGFLDLTPARPGRGRRHRFRPQMVWDWDPDRVPEPFELCHRKTRTLHLAGDYERSSALLAGLLDRAAAFGDSRWVAIFSGDLADDLVSMGRHQEALPLALRAQEIFGALGDERGLAGALHHLGRIHEDRSEGDSSAACYRRLLEISERTGQSELSVQALSALRGHYERDHLIGRYLGFLEQGRASGNKPLVAQSLFYLEDLHLCAGEWPQAEEYNRALYLTARETGDRLGMSYAIGDRGLILDAQGRHQEAIDCFREKLAISESMGDFYNVFEALSNLGASHMIMGDFRTASEYFSRAAAHAGRHQVRRHQCSALQHLAHCLFELGRHRKASEVNAEALGMAREAGVDKVVFYGRLLEARLAALDDAPGAAGMLRDLLPVSEDDEDRAVVHRELYAVTGDGSHRDLAVSDYRRHYEKTKLHYLLERIKKLEEGEK